MQEHENNIVPIKEKKKKKNFFFFFFFKQHLVSFPLQLYSLNLGLYNIDSLNTLGYQY